MYMWGHGRGGIFERARSIYSLFIIEWRFVIPEVFCMVIGVLGMCRNYKIAYF